MDCHDQGHRHRHRQVQVMDRRVQGHRHPDQSNHGTCRSRLQCCRPRLALQRPPPPRRQTNHSTWS